ncbi:MULTISPECIES: putative phage abortive infection protein [Saccharibacillus]|uniref:putative phage abortive infection protein n=1 Tax=Saccharibacillus TaxID=456492 RepID=UPI0013120FB7|nr:putative phage abortive infection protein [Saccharibacillus sp. WB 17]MWJ30598.1 hypothetical protein [Saccharibacillus sp. WB 17]
MKDRLYNLFIKRVSIDVEEKVELKETEEIKLLNVFYTVLVVWIVVGGALFFYKDRGTFGDMFGSINTIFSGFAFGGIIYTIYQQRAEFRLQREELRLQRNEVAKTNAALDEQVKAANVQRFENTFFNMIQLHNHIVKDIVVIDDYVHPSNLTPARFIENRNYTGKEAFSYLYDMFNGDYLHKFSNEETDNEDALELVRQRLSYLDKSYHYFFTRYENMLQPYYKNLLNLLATVDENEWINEKEKKYYMRIVESQLSPDELLMLFYKTLTKKGFKLHEITKKYSLMDDLDQGKILIKSDLMLYRNKSNPIS